MGAETAERSTLIAHLNDQLRRSGEGGRIFLTRGVQALGEQTIMEVMIAVQEFSDFTPENDPHNEHDFGSVSVGNEQFYWKVDYYDPSLTYGSEDPADESKTCRVLTIMLQEEY